MSRSRNIRGFVPPKDLTKRVRAVLERLGIRSGAEALAMTSNTCLAIASGLRVQRGSLLMCEQGIAAAEATPTPPPPVKKEPPERPLCVGWLGPCPEQRRVTALRCVTCSCRWVASRRQAAGSAQAVRP